MVERELGSRMSFRIAASRLTPMLNMFVNRAMMRAKISEAASQLVAICVDLCQAGQQRTSVMFDVRNAGASRVHPDNNSDRRPEESRVGGKFVLSSEYSQYW